MKVLSLFDGISCGRVALERAGIEVTEYYASEVDKYAIQTSEKNYPDIIRLGDVKTCEIPKDIDILFAGFPCQSFSIAGNRKGFDDDRGNLFFDMMRIFKEVKPKYFLFENVASMKKSDKKILDEIIGVEGVVVNSALVSAQQRKRIYWTNIPFEQPEDKGIILKDIIEDNVSEDYFIGNLFNKRVFTDKSGTIGTSAGRTAKQGIGVYRIEEATKRGYVDIPPECGVDLTQPNSKTRRGRKMEFKSNCLMANATQYCWNVGEFIRKLTPIEYERLQTLPDNYTEGCSNTQRYKQCGNGWTVDVIAHILGGINEKEENTA